MIWYTLFNTIFCSKTNSKEVIELWNCDFSYLHTVSSIIGKISVTGSCLEQTWERTSLRLCKCFLFSFGTYGSGEDFQRLGYFWQFFTSWIIQNSVSFKRAHKECIGQNELVMSLLEDLTLKFRSSSNLYRFLNSMGMTSYTLSILFFALKP
jgi:hypothetical protein